MLDLVWRTVRAVCIVLAALAVVSFLLEYRWGARTPGSAAQLLADHYATRQLDNNWEVRRVEAEPGRVIVHLRIPTGPAGAFQRIPAGAQFQAFGPICPASDHPVWDRMQEGEDIFIHSASSSGESILRRLSCRRWNRLSAEAGRRSRRGKVASSASKLPARAHVSLAAFTV